MKAFFSIICLLTSLFAAGQPIISTVYFENYEYSLGDDDRLIIDGLASVINSDSIIVTAISINGFADTTATEGLNMELSRLRAVTVAAELKDKISPEKARLVKTKWYGETKPADLNSIMHFSRRCVDLIVQYRPAAPPPNISLLYDEIRKPVQHFTIDPSRDTILSGTGGTIIAIQANSFIIPKSCSGQMVDIVLQESLDPASMILNHLNTMAGSKQLESGGMVFVNAQMCNRILSLKEDKSIAVYFPSETIKDGMELFSGRKQTNGNINWQTSGESMQPIYNYEIENFLSKTDFYRSKLVEKCPFFFCGLKGMIGLDNSGDIEKHSYHSLDWIAWHHYSDSICKAYGVRDINQLYNIMNERKRKNLETNYYLTQSTGLGNMNCDRFYNVPAEQKASIAVMQKPADNISACLVFKEFQSILNGANDGGTQYTFSDIATGSKCYLVMIRYENKKSFLSVQEIEVKPDLVVTPAFKEVTIDQLKEELGKLNS